LCKDAICADDFAATISRSEKITGLELTKTSFEKRLRKLEDILQDDEAIFTLFKA